MFEEKEFYYIFLCNQTYKFYIFALISKLMRFYLFQNQLNR